MNGRNGISVATRTTGDDLSLERLTAACLPDLEPRQALRLGLDVGLEPWLLFRSIAIAPVGTEDSGVTRDAWNDATSKGRPWTDREVTFLEENIGRMELEDIASALGRTTNAIKVRAARRNISLRQARSDAGVYTARQAARLLGVKCAKTVVRFIQDGFLDANVAGSPLQPHSQEYRITREALLAFVQTTLAAISIDPRAIRDAELRAAWQQAGHHVWISSGQAAEELGIATNTLSRLARTGQVSAFRWGNWYFREEDLSAIRCLLVGRARQRLLHLREASPRRFGSTEIQKLLAGASLGYNATALAEKVGRPIGSVYGLFCRLTPELSRYAAELPFLWRDRGEGKPTALLGLPEALPGYPTAAAIDALYKGNPSATDWPHLRAWLRAWFQFWLEPNKALPDTAAVPYPDLYHELRLTNHHLCVRIPNDVTLPTLVDRGLFLLRTIGLDPIGQRWHSRWEPHRLAGRVIPPAEIERSPIETAADAIALRDVVAQIGAQFER